MCVNEETKEREWTAQRKYLGEAEMEQGTDPVDIYPRSYKGRDRDRDEERDRETERQKGRHTQKLISADRDREHTKRD